MPSWSEVLGKGPIRGQQALGMAHRCQPLHAPLALACGAMRVLTAVVARATLAVCDPGQDRPRGRTVALELIGNKDAGHIRQPLEQRTEQLFRGLLVPTALHQHSQHVIVLIDGAPQGMACTIDGQQDLVEVLRVSWLGASTLQLMRVVLPKLPTPLAHGYMRDVDTACKEELLHVAVAQGEARSEPDARADDLTGDAVVCVALGVSGWRHVGLLLLRLARSVRGHRGGHDVTG